MLLGKKVAERDEMEVKLRRNNEKEVAPVYKVLA